MDSPNSSNEPLNNIQCRVPGCTNTALNSPASVGFHHPPVVKAPAGIREAWKMFCFNDPKISCKPVICSEHFDEEDFIGSYRHSNPILKRDAVPKYRPAEYVMTAEDVPMDPSEENDEYLVLQDLPEEAAEEGQEYILSDNVDEAVSSEFILTDHVDENNEEMVVETESGSYYILNGTNLELPEGMSLVEDPNNVIPPLITFDGKIFQNMKEQNGCESSSIISRPPDNSASKISCHHKENNERLQKLNKELEHEIAKLKIDLQDLREDIKAVTPAGGGDASTKLYNLFTKAQIERIEGQVSDTWDIKDLQRALFLYNLNPYCYMYFKSKYMFPMPKISHLEIFQKIDPAIAANVLREVEQFKKFTHFKKI